jgi:hypothetical protein
VRDYRFSNEDAVAFTIAFIKGNWRLSVSTIGILMIIFSLSVLLPKPINITVLYIYSFFFTSVQIYVAKISLESAFSHDMESMAKKTSLKEIFTDNIVTAVAVIVAINITILTLFMIFYATFPEGVENLSEESEFTPVVTIMMLILIFLEYFFPASIGLSFRTTQFKDAFLNYFKLFTPSLWKRAFNRDYFVFVFIWAVTNILIFVLIGIFSSIIFLLPFAILLIYFMLIYNAICYVNVVDRLR